VSILSPHQQNRRETLLGFQGDLFLLPFDHRSSFEKDLFGIVDRVPTAQETEEISAYKKVIYAGFRRAIACGVSKRSAGILVDEQFGSDILRDAKSNGILTACCVEKSGQEEFDFEYGSDFKKHILKIQPDFVKALVRYNPENDIVLNRRQARRLKLLSDFCHKNGFRFMFELLVPATGAQLTRVDKDPRRYDVELRPALMINTIQELQGLGVEPDLWKVEGLYSIAECTNLAAQARADQRDNVAVIVLGRAEDKETIIKWLSTAAEVSSYKGFAIGRTVWEDSLKKLKSGEFSASDASKEIAEKYKFFCDLWVNTKPQGREKAA
jgi:myo-inositol catabolism protein IolC